MWQEWQNSAEFSQLQQARDAELRSALKRGGSRRTESAAADLGSGQKTVLAAVLGVNMSVFAAWQYGRWDPESGVEAWMWEHFTASKRALHQNHFYTLLTNSVSHRDVGHFAFNMWFLYVVGQNLLGTVSPPAFLGLYAVSGVASTALQLYTSTGDVRSLGASGAAYAIAGAAFASSPHALYGTLLGVMPAWQLGLILLAWEAYSWRQQRAAGEIGGVGRAAHLSGFALGVCYGIALRRLGRGAAGF